MKITKIFRFEACHSVKNAYTCRCDREQVGGGIHGHSYVIEVTLDGDVQPDGMVIDFSLLKERFSHIIDAFDHTFIVNSTDNVLVKLAPYLSSRFIIFSGNPTAENMAQYFFNYINAALKLDNPQVIIDSVTVWETVTGKATCMNAESAIVPTLVCSASISSKWSNLETETFITNNGVIMPTYPLISDVQVKVSDWDQSVTITATTNSTTNSTTNKNC